MQHLLFRLLVVSFLVVVPLRLKAASYLFVFDGTSPTATVYDARSLERLASPAVGLRAAYAFGVPDPADVRRIAKFYVVSEGAVAILNGDFSLRGNLFLPEPVARGSHAAALSPDSRRLLVAAGNSVYVIDTSTDKIAATLEPGFAPTMVLALPGSERAYVTSSESSFLRVIDLTANALLDLVAELPTVPTAMTASPNGSRIYASSPGALYNLSQLSPDFFQPLSALETQRRAGLPGARFTLANAPGGRMPSPKNEAPDLMRSQRLAIDRLLLTNDGQFVMRLGDGFRHGRLDPSSPFLEFQNPATGETLPASDIAAVTASPDGATKYIATRGQPRLIQANSACTVEQHSVDLAEAPVAMALVGGPVEQQNCTLPKGGDGQVVVENTAFQLTIGNSSTPIGGVEGRVTTSPPGLVDCGKPFLITGGGPTTFTCGAGEVAGVTDVQITVTSSLGCAIYNIKIAPQGSTVDGLTKTFGDGISILRNTAFQLLVEARSGGNPQNGLVLNVAATPGSPTIVCPGMVSTSSNGVATITCSAGNVTANTPAQVQVTDSTNASRTVTFDVTVLAAGNPSTGLNKVSADPRTVASGQEFALVASAFSGTTPQSGLVLTASPNSTLLNCDAQATTDASGRAEINCEAEQVVANTQVNVTVGDGTRSVVFIVNIVPTGSLVDGLSIVSGNNQFVPRLSAFPLPLVVRAVKDGAPQQGVRLNVTANPFGIIFCSASTLTDENGVGSFSCSANTVSLPNFVTINVSDTSTPPRTLPEPFRATILPGSPGIATNVEILSAPTVEGGVGTTVEEGVRIRATNASGITSGAIIYFFSSDDLSFNPPAAITDVNGEATTNVTFGCPTRSMGLINIGLEPTVATRTVNYRAVLGPLVALTKLGGDNQSGAAGLILSQALLLRAGDACNNGVPRLPVAWTINPPEAAELVTPISQMTDNSGRASTRVRLLGRSGPFTVNAAVEGFNAVFNLAATATANRIVLSSGNNQSIALGQTTQQPLVVRVLSDTDIGVNGVNVSFNVISGSGSVSPPAATTDGQGLAATSVTAGNVFGPIVVEATAVIQNESRTVRFTVNTVGRTPAVTLLSFVGGADFRQGWVSGSTGSIFGVGLMEGVDGVALPTPNIAAALSTGGPAQAGGVWPTEFRGVSVTVNGIRAPILGLANVNGQEQINIQVPFGIAAGAIPVVVTNNGSSTTISGVQVAAVQPGIFEVSVEGGRFAAALHADYSLVTPSNPARPGEVIQLFLSGLGATNPAVPTNAVGPVPLARTTQPPTVGIDGVGQAIIEDSAFYAPGLVSVYQINFVVGAATQAGNRNLNVALGGATSQTVMLPVQR